MQRIDTIVIGAGQAGLATSRLLVAAGRDHVVLERGRVGERWRSERWDSLRLLTPNWMMRLPDLRYDGDDPDGFMPAAELADRFDRYARGFEAPVRGGTAVRTVRVAGDGDGFVVVTDDGTWQAKDVVVATGWCGRPTIPRAASSLAMSIDQLHSGAYRNPRSLPDGPVLVVGASASGVQLAEELRRDGREVLLSVGTHTRLPRTYRGHDILWWLDRIGVLDTPADSVPARAKQQPSLQLVGRPGPGLDLGTLAAAGVQLVGRLRSISGFTARFAADISVTTRDADRRMQRMLDRIDQHMAASGAAEPAPARPVPPVVLPAGPTAVDLRRAGIRSVLWATGHRPHFPWLDVPVFDTCGAIVHQGGVTAVPGLYVVGMRWQTRRSSTFIDGVGHDARAVVDHLLARHRTAVAA